MVSDWLHAWWRTPARAAGAQLTEMSAKSTLTSSAMVNVDTRKRSEPTRASSCGPCVTTASSTTMSVKNWAWYGRHVSRRHTWPRMSAAGVSSRASPTAGTSMPSSVTGRTMPTVACATSGVRALHSSSQLDAGGGAAAPPPLGTAGIRCCECFGGASSAMRERPPPSR